MSDNYIRTLGYVLKRTNYGEADRILNILTPFGKISAIAKGVRKEKSKLAGGVEMFSLIDFNLHRGKRDLYTVTGAKMMKYYGSLVKNYTKMETAAMLLKKISIAANGSDSEEYFNVLKQSLVALDSEYDSRLIEVWFLLNLNRIVGEEINLYRDGEGEKLEAGRRYDWDYQNSCFFERVKGEFDENDIKLLRIISSNSLDTVRRVRVDDETVLKAVRLVRDVSRV